MNVWRYSSSKNKSKSSISMSKNALDPKVALRSKEQKR